MPLLGGQVHLVSSRPSAQSPVERHKRTFSLARFSSGSVSLQSASIAAV